MLFWEMPCTLKGPLLAGWGQTAGGVPTLQAPQREHWPPVEMKAAQVSPVVHIFPTSTPANSRFLIYISRESVSWKL